MTRALGMLHVHSDYSHDAIDSLERIREAAVERGLGWVATTDHAEDLDADGFQEYLAHCLALSDDQFRFIPGLEFRFASCRGVHLLAVGLTEWITPRTPDELFRYTDGRGVMTILAHPVLCRYAPPAIVREQVNGIELWNARYNTRHVPDPRAIELYWTLSACRTSLVATIGADQHDVNDHARLLIASDPTYIDDPVAALRDGAYSNVAPRATFDAHARFSPMAMRSIRMQRLVVDAALRARARISAIAP